MILRQLGRPGLVQLNIIKRAIFGWLLQLGLRKLYIQVRHNKAEIVQIISFVIFCIFSEGDQVMMAESSAPLVASSARRTDLAYKLLTDVFFDRFMG